MSILFLKIFNNLTTKKKTLPVQYTGSMLLSMFLEPILHWFTKIIRKIDKISKNTKHTPI